MIPSKKALAGGAEIIAGKVPEELSKLALSKLKAGQGADEATPPPHKETLELGAKQIKQTLQRYTAEDKYTEHKLPPKSPHR